MQPTEKIQVSPTLAIGSGPLTLRKGSQPFEIGNSEFSDKRMTGQRQRPACVTDRGEIYIDVDVTVHI
jgi:hypothetical protein